MSAKIYILNTRMTSSVYIKMMRKLGLPITSEPDETNCVIVEPENLDFLLTYKNVDNYLICGREIGKDDVIKYLMTKYTNIKLEDFIVIDIHNIIDFDYIMQEYNFPKVVAKNLLKRNDESKNNLIFINKNYDEEYYNELCYEYFYTFVKPFYPDLRAPKVEILDEMQGFLHIKKSVYKTIGDKLFEEIFRIKPKIRYKKLEKLFLTGFGGFNIKEKEINKTSYKEYNLIVKPYFNIYDRYVRFLEKSKCVFGLYYDDSNNTCYVIKNVSKKLSEAFSYKVGNHQYSYIDGIKVPKWVYDTPADELNIEKVLSLKNIDVRAQAIKKAGLLNLINKGTIIDSWEKYPDNEWWAKSEYKLVDMHNFVPPVKVINHLTKRLITTEPIKYAPFLCMKNQTTGEYHLEGVSPECRNLYDALKMRYKDLDLPSFEIKDIK